MLIFEIVTFYRNISRRRVTISKSDIVLVKVLISSIKVLCIQCNCLVTRNGCIEKEANK